MLRLRQTDGLYMIPFETVYFNTLSDPMDPCSDLIQTSRSVKASPRCIGTTKIVYDEYPSSWDTRIPSFHSFEIRSGSGGSDSTKMTVLNYARGCSKYRKVTETLGPLALMHGGWVYDLSAVVEDPKTADRAMQDAWNRVTQPDIDFGENLANMAQTIKMINDPLKGLAAVLRKMVRGCPPGLKRIPKTPKEERNLPRQAKKSLAFLENRWLEYRYGIVPLAQDVSKGIEIYTEKFKVDADVKVSHGSAPGFKTEQVSEAVYGAGTPGIFTNFRTTLQTSTKTRACVYHQNVFGDKGIDPVLRQIGLHPFQLGNLAWNLLPLSFVVDWTWDVSSFIASMSPVADKRFFGTTTSWKSQSIIEKRILGFFSTTHSKRVTGAPCRATGTTRKYKRVCNRPFPVKLLRGADLSTVKRAIDALALTMQNIPRLLRH